MTRLFTAATLAICAALIIGGLVLAIYASGALLVATLKVLAFWR